MGGGGQTKKGKEGPGNFGRIRLCPEIIIPEAATGSQDTTANLHPETHSSSPNGPRTASPQTHPPRPQTGPENHPLSYT